MKFSNPIIDQSVMSWFISGFHVRHVAQLACNQASHVKVFRGGGVIPTIRLMVPSIAPPWNQWDFEVLLDRDLAMNPLVPGLLLLLRSLGRLDLFMLLFDCTQSGALGSEEMF